MTINRAGLRSGRELRPHDQRAFLRHSQSPRNAIIGSGHTRQDAEATWRKLQGIPHADATDKEIEELIERLKVFKEDEFADLLHQCHNVIRNREKRDPVAAFDEIAKMLFIKVYVERELKAKRKRQNLFSVDYLEEQLGDNPLGRPVSENQRRTIGQTVSSNPTRN